MPKVKAKPKRVRPARAGAVLVELTADERAALLRHKDRLAAQTGERISMAGAIRNLIRRADG